MGKTYWMDHQDGNFSNDKDDTFNPKKDYIGIRLQQSVPLLDRDWNELEDIRRYQEMILRRWYIGDGTPDNGFSITCDTADPTQINISAGRYLVDGFEAVNENRKGPILGKYDGKYDLVYLDLCISEIHGTHELKNSQDVNMETCARHKINWEVKAIENEDFNYFTQDLEAMLNKSGKKEPYHHYSPLALLDRSHAFDAQNPQTIVIDLRGIANCAPITHSISASRFKEIGESIYVTDITDEKYAGKKILQEISIKKAATIWVSNDMVPYCPYRYILFAEATKEDVVPTPENPLTSTIRFKRNFYKYGEIGVQAERDSKDIVIKSEYGFFTLDQYTSDSRPFRRGTPQVIIENIGDNNIKIHGLGFIYSRFGQYMQ